MKPSLISRSPRRRDDSVYQQRFDARERRLAASVERRRDCTQTPTPLPAPAHRPDTSEQAHARRALRHELAHLRERTHSLAFYNLLDLAMPQWRDMRRLLNDLPLSALPTFPG